MCPHVKGSSLIYDGTRKTTVLLAYENEGKQVGEVACKLQQDVVSGRTSV